MKNLFILLCPYMSLGCVYVENRARNVADMITTAIEYPVAGAVVNRLAWNTNAYRMGGILTLNKRQEDFINNWESEAFRKKSASSKK